MIELFRKGETSATFQAHRDKLTKIIAEFSDEIILGADFEEWTHYYFEEYKIQPIILYMDDVTQSLSETKIEKNNPWYRNNDADEPKTFRVDGYRITFTIPFDGDSGLLYLRPSKYYMSTFRIDSIIEGNEASYGNIVFSIEYTKEELMGKETPEFISQAFTNKFKHYMETIDRINREVEQFNESLQSTIMSALESRKKKADEYIALGEKLSIPLKINPNAPHTKPIPLKKAHTKKPEMPSVRPREKEYAISLEHYDNIRRIIYTTGTSMEKTAKTYIKLDEEELRDVMLSHLNSHYNGSATGETFSKVGKTDILIPFENKAAYIAECKIWNGIKQLEEALLQLFNYTTWRDVRTSLILFNKTNKDFFRLLNTVKSHLDNSEICKNITNSNANEWLCTFKKSTESTEVIDVQIVAFDLCLHD